jgi:hypothetical protein
MYGSFKRAWPCVLTGLHWAGCLVRVSPCEEYGDGKPVQHYAQLPPVAWAYYAKGVSTRLMRQAKGLDPLYHYIGIGSDLRNWMPDTGVSSHFTPCYWIYRKWKRV